MRQEDSNSGSDTNISSDVKWEFLIKSYTDPGYGISTAETTATCFGHYDKDQDVDSGATYCFYCMVTLILRRSGNLSYRDTMML